MIQPIDEPFEDAVEEPDEGAAARPEAGKRKRKRPGPEVEETPAEPAVEQVGEPVDEVSRVALDAGGEPPVERVGELEGEVNHEPEGEADEVEAAGELRLEPGELRGALEAVLFSVAQPITIRTLSEVFGATVHEVREAVEELRLEYIDTHRSFRIEDIAGGVQLLTLSRYDPWIRRMRRKEREGKLSAAALETLAVIAYKQPINKADLESIRGVNCSPTLKTLLDRGLIQVAGREEGLGKPILYGTTRRFLESFGINSIRELPQPELEKEMAEKLGESPAAVPAEAPEETPGASEG